jgi:hypothetical protein
MPKQAIPLLIAGPVTLEERLLALQQALAHGQTSTL